jgi:hypothetical protein
VSGHFGVGPKLKLYWIKQGRYSIQRGRSCDPTRPEKVSGNATELRFRSQVGLYCPFTTVKDLGLCVFQERLVIISSMPFRGHLTRWQSSVDFSEIDFGNLWIDTVEITRLDGRAAVKRDCLFLVVFP